MSPDTGWFWEVLTEGAVGKRTQAPERGDGGSKGSSSLFPLYHVPPKLIYCFQQEISSPGSKHDHPVSSWGRYFEGGAQAGGSRSQGVGRERLHPAPALAALSYYLVFVQANTCCHGLKLSVQLFLWLWTEVCLEPWAERNLCCGKESYFSRGTAIIVLERWLSQLSQCLQAGECAFGWLHSCKKLAP